MNLANIPFGELILVLIAQFPNNLLKKSHDLSIIVLVGPALAHRILPVLHILQFDHVRVLHLRHPTIYLHQIIVRVAALVYRWPIHRFVGVVVEEFIALERGVNWLVALAVLVDVWFVALEGYGLGVRWLLKVDHRLRQARCDVRTLYFYEGSFGKACVHFYWQIN